MRADDRRSFHVAPPFKGLVLVICLLTPIFGEEPAVVLNSAEGLPANRRLKLDQLLREAPDKAAASFCLALEYAEIGNRAKALGALKYALRDLPWLDPSSETAFRAISNSVEFQELARRVLKKFPPLATRELFCSIPEKDLIAEGIAADSNDGTLYLGSIYRRKILKISPAGEVGTFVPEAQDGLLGVLGLRVDSRDRTLWAASALRGKAALYHFDKEGRTLGVYPVTGPGKHELNDLVVTSSGQVFVTDSEEGRLYQLSGPAGHLTPVKLFLRYKPNGIALSSDESLLYVAHAFGIKLINLRNGAESELTAPPDISLAQVDGLYFRNNNLVAIQNALGANRIVQLTLTPNGTSVVGGQVLLYQASSLELPTTGACWKDEFFFIVNSQIDHERNGMLIRPDELQPVRIAVLKLPNTDDSISTVRVNLGGRP